MPSRFIYCCCNPRQRLPRPGVGSFRPGVGRFRPAGQGQAAVLTITRWKQSLHAVLQPAVVHTWPRTGNKTATWLYAGRKIPNAMICPTAPVSLLPSSTIERGYCRRLFCCPWGLLGQYPCTLYTRLSRGRYEGGKPQMPWSAPTAPVSFATLY